MYKSPNIQKLKRRYHDQETFIPNHLGTPTDLKPLLKGFQLAQINIVQQAFKEQYAK